MAETRRQTTTRSLLLLIWFLAVAPITGVFLVQKGAVLTALVLTAGPVAPLLILLSGDPVLHSVFPASLAITNLLGVVMLLAAARKLSREWQEGPVQSASRPIDAAGSRRPSADLLLIRNPVLWLAERHSLALRNFWIVSVITVFAAVTVVFLAPANWQTPGLGCLLVFLHFMLSINVSALACRALAEDRSAGLLELLLTTPLPEQDVCSGHLLAIKRAIVPAFTFLLLLGAAWIADIARHDHGAAWLIYAPGYVVFALLHVFEMWITARLGLWKGLHLANSAHAFRRSLTSGLFIAAVALVVIAFLLGTLTPALSRDDLFMVGGVALVVASGAGIFGALGLAATRLADDLRTVAAAPPGKAAFTPR